MININDIAAFFQILSFLWTLLFGGYSIFQVIKAIRDHIKNNHITRVNYKLIGSVVAALTIFVIISSFFPPKDILTMINLSHSTPTISTVTTAINETISTTGTSYSKVMKVYNSITAQTYHWSDRLNSQEDVGNKNGWSLTNNSGPTGCLMQNDGYEAYSSKKGYVGECIATKTNFKDFAFQADMYIHQGLSGGLIFRAGLPPSFNSPMYRFDVSHSGIYDIYVQLNNQKGHNIPCGIQKEKNEYYCYSSAIHQGYKGSMNQLMVVIQRNIKYFYMNGTPLLVEIDNAYSSGAIGVFANDFPDPTKVEFRNAEIWTDIPNIQS